MQSCDRRSVLCAVPQGGNHYVELLDWGNALVFAQACSGTGDAGDLDLGIHIGTSGLISNSSWQIIHVELILLVNCELD